MTRAFLCAAFQTHFADGFMDDGSSNLMAYDGVKKRMVVKRIARQLVRVVCRAMALN